MKTKKKASKILGILFTTMALAGFFSFPCFAVNKTQTRTKAGYGCAVDATMNFNLNNDKVSGGTCTRVKKNGAFWFSIYNSVGKSPYRYSSNRYYGVHTSGLWADPGEKGRIVNIDVTGFR